MPVWKSGHFPLSRMGDIRPSACQDVTQTALSERRSFGARATLIGDILKHNDYSPSTMFCIEW